MRLFEFFDESPMNMEQELGDMIANSLAPLVASGVPHVSIDSVIEKLRQGHTGIRIDRGMAMQLCDPGQMPFVKSIEGDNLILNEPSYETASTAEDDMEKRQEKIKSTAEKQATKEIKNKKKMTKKAASGPL